MTIDEFRTHIGATIGASSWLTIDQPGIDQFADATLDHQFIHVDPIRAAETPFGATIAHGFFILSLLSHFAESVLPPIDNLVMSINYGFDRVRFVSPVRAGARIRGVFALAALNLQAPGRYQMRLAATVEIEHEIRPALSADWLPILMLSTT